METTTALAAAAPETPAPPTFAGLYTIARATLLSQRRRFSGPSWDVEDILHDTVLVAHRQLDRYVTPAGASPERALAAWLHGIARRLADRRRKRRAIPPSLPVEDGVPVPDPETLAGEAERRRRLDGLLRGLRSERAQVLALAGDGLPAREIARTLGIKENTVKSRLHRGLRDAREATRRQKLTARTPYPPPRRWG